MAVVSSSRNTPEVLDAAGLTARFGVVVDGNVLAAEGLPGKPAPDMFLLAADRLGVDPARAMVVEDAIAGVAAGRAGAFGVVVGVDRGASREALLANGADGRRRRPRRARRRAGRDALTVHRIVPRQLPVHRFRTEPWCLTERGFDHVDTGLTETLFALGNGYLGLRGDHEEDRGGSRPGRVRQRLPRDVEHPPRRGCLRVRHDRSDDRQRARRQDRQPVRRRRAARAGRRRPRVVRAPARPAPRHARARPRVAHAPRQAGAGALGAVGVAHAAARGGDSLRRHDGERRRRGGGARRGCSTGRPRAATPSPRSSPTTTTRRAR